MAYDSTLEGWASAWKYVTMKQKDIPAAPTELTVRLAQALGVKDNGITHVTGEPFYTILEKWGCRTVLCSRPVR